MAICLERGADCLRMVQLMPLPSQTLIIDVDVDVEDVLAQAMCLFASFSGR